MNKVAEATKAKTAKSEETKPQTVTAEPPKIGAKTLTLEKPHVFSDPDAGKMEPPTIPTINQRLERYYQLEKLVFQRDEVTEALEKLQKFEQHPNGWHKVTLHTADGMTSTTSHPVAIAAMLQSAVTQLRAKLADIDSQIVF